ncbi:MAG: hypothetical protein Q4G27_11185 [Flavobacteriaceae bacterium]|nr:hypothetical protein [Flavobacteriaceae bacterium]
MNHFLNTITDSPLVLPEIEICSDTRKLLSEVSEESQVVVHCSITAQFPQDAIRIWKTTYLFAHESAHRSKLIFFENITLYPDWTYMKHGETIVFTLIFGGLPKSCRVFDMVEVIPELGGFEVRNIRRNRTDVYFVEL